MRVCGVDEAGRGPVIGPLVVAGVATDDEASIRELGVKDSKLLSPIRREGLAIRIKERAEVVVKLIQPWEIDRLRETLTLNEVECKTFADVIASMDPDVAYVDAVDVDEARFATDISNHLEKKVEIVSEHKADAKYPIVSAASIVAKVRRDMEIENIKIELGYDLGSGYPSDPKTIDAIKRMIDRGKISKYVRRSWDTFKRLSVKGLDRWQR
jgi:ribonuclease HII